MRIGSWLTIAACAVVACVAAWLTLLPVPIDPKPFHAAHDRGLRGPFAPKRSLDALELLELGGSNGPADGAVDAEGRIYVSVRNGDIVRLDPQGRHPQRFARTGGLPLGLAFDGSGTLWVADAARGLLSIARNGEVSVRSTSAGGTPIRYADDLEVTADGSVYFSDASTKFGATAYGGVGPSSLLDITEHGLYGRLLRYDPKSGETRVVRRGFSFANGVALAPDDSFLLLSETGMHRIHRLWLRGERAGRWEIAIDGLPGFPDNVETGAEGRFWVGLVAPRSAPLDMTADKPWLRAMMLRLPEPMRPAPQRSTHVFAIDAAGNVVCDLQDPDARHAQTTGAFESAGALYVTSLGERALGRLAATPCGGAPR